MPSRAVAALVLHRRQALHFLLAKAPSEDVECRDDVRDARCGDERGRATLQCPTKNHLLGHHVPSLGDGLHGVIHEKARRSSRDRGQVCALGARHSARRVRDGHVHGILSAEAQQVVVAKVRVTFDVAHRRSHF